MVSPVAGLIKSAEEDTEADKAAAVLQLLVLHSTAPVYDDAPAFEENAATVFEHVVAAVEFQLP